MKEQQWREEKSLLELELLESNVRRRLDNTLMMITIIIIISRIMLTVEYSTHAALASAA